MNPETENGTMTSQAEMPEFVEVVCETEAATLERWRAAAAVNPDWTELSTIVAVVPIDADRVRLTVRFVYDYETALGHLYLINDDPDTLPAEVVEHFDFYADFAVREAQQVARLALVPYRPWGWEPPPNTWTMHWPREYASDIAAAIDSGMRAGATFLRVSDCTESSEPTYALTVSESLYREINAAQDRIVRDRRAADHSAPIFEETVWFLFTGKG